MNRRNAILWIGSVKIYGLVALYALFLQTALRKGDPGFVFVPEGKSRAERLEAIEKSFWERLAPYDGQWYLDIAENGYRRLSESESRGGRLPPANSAFFPLLPAVLRLIRLLFPTSYLLITVLLGVIASATGVFCAALIAKRLDINPSITAVLLLAFPTAAFQYVLYTEGFFLLLSSLALLFALERRSISAALLGCLAGLCRPQGVLLTLPIAAELLFPALRRKDRSMRETLFPIIATLAPLSGFAFMAGANSLEFLNIQAEWGRSYHALNVLEALLSAVGYRGPPFDLFGLVFALALLPLAWRRLPLSLALYGTAAVVLPLLTGSLLSLGRFLSVSTPHFLCLALYLESRTRLRNVLLLAFVLLQVLVAKGLIGWYFVG